MTNTSGFYKYILQLDGYPFGDLSEPIHFEDVAKGRKGNHLVNIGDLGVPIVRTTTRYSQPAHRFSAIHQKLVECIQHTVNQDQQAQLPALSFNNALIEIYDRSYFKMNYHSDQALDLEANTYIALYSCYEHPDPQSTRSLRTLKIKNKISNEEIATTLDHNSVVLFSLATNKQHLHKIILEHGPSPHSTIPDNRWLGITLRKSKTYIRFHQNIPYLSNGSTLQRFLG